MKIKVKDLMANPHRRIKEYQIQEEKVQTLMNSINETFFWDNLIARPAPMEKDKYEIAYGHHRLEALKRLKIAEIDIPVKVLNDFVMLKIMADENAEEYSMQPSVLNETVLSVKIFLDKEIKDKEWQDVMSQQMLRQVFEDKQTFQHTKAKGCGETTIKNFLGPNWSQRRIREALAALHTDESKFDRKAAEKMKSVEAASTFRKAVTDYNIPKQKQKALADKLAKEGASSKEVFRTVRKSIEKPFPKGRDPLLDKLEKTVTAIEDAMNALTNKIAGFNAEARNLNIKEIGGVKAAFSSKAASDLLIEIKEYLTLFGFDFKRLQIGGN